MDASKQLRAQLPRMQQESKHGGGPPAAAVRPAPTLATAVAVLVLLLVSVLFGARWTPSGGGDGSSWVSAGVRVVGDSAGGEASSYHATVAAPHDRLLGGLLSPDFDERSCLSRYQAALYRKPSLHVLSTHLLAKLRRYESLHRRCGPATEPFAHAVARLRSPPNASTPAAECSYMVWSPMEGLGNRILTLASAFLYALLTDRVLLFHRPGDDLDDLFCEPFPGSTWVLPSGDFPIRSIEHFDIGTHESYGNIVRRGEAEAKGTPPPEWAYVHLQHNYDRHPDRLFFCEEGQDTLQRVNWLVLRSDNYFVPGLFMIPRYKDELERMFPRRDTVFHHLGRYLFHPSNTVWGMVVRYHGSYLARAEERVGIQVRQFSWAPISTDERYNQIISCTHKENILPEANANDSSKPPPTGDQPATTKAVLVVSLHGEYYERIRNLYYEHGTAGNEAVSVYQPTHEGGQRSGERQHNQKAFAEMTLLSFSDVAVTTAASTFGYVGHGLAGLRPWVLMTPVGGKAPDPPCQRAVSTEPCFHTPPNYSCQARADSDTGRMVRHVRHCEDFPGGVQLVD